MKIKLNCKYLYRREQFIHSYYLMLTINSKAGQQKYENLSVPLNSQHNKFICSQYILLIQTKTIVCIKSVGNCCLNLSP